MAILSNPTFLGIIISALIAVGSWFIIAELNRRHEIKKRRLDLRIETLFDIQKLFDMLSISPKVKANEMDELIKTIKYKLRACGSDEESEMWQNVVHSLQELKNAPQNQDKFIKANNDFRKAQILFYGNLRKEFGLKPQKLFDN
jgi:hypothetical protein